MIKSPFHSVLTLFFVACVWTAKATNLYVSSYDGNVFSVALTQQNEEYNISITSRDRSCAPSPSWLTWDAPSRTLYCLDEGTTTPNGSITAYTASADGKLSAIQRTNLTAPAPVSGTMFGGVEIHGYAIAHYSGQISSLVLSNATSLNLSQQMNFTGLTRPGPNIARQDGSHIHEALLDPTGEYILFPDLGADLIRVYCWGPDTHNNTLEGHPSIKVAPGSGPRHAAFWSTDTFAENITSGVYIFLVAELDNSLTAYEVNYPQEGGLNVTEVYKTNTFGGGIAPNGAAAAEIIISPDRKFAIVSNRYDSSFQIENYHPQNSTLESSDTLATFEINTNGTLALKQLWPAGGVGPRHFSLNKNGDLLAVGLQNSGRVVILERNVQSGELGYAVAAVDLGAPGVTCVVWDEDE